MTKRLTILVLILAVLSCRLMAAGADSVSVWTETQTIPTFDIGKGSPVATIFNEDWNAAYPRTMLEISTRAEKPVDKEYSMSVLENEYLRVEVLPEVGGRVWRIIDRKTGRNLLWTNDAVKPVRVGRRGGWIAGGIEFPFPVGNHGEDTIAPYRTVIRQNPDGGATITVSSFDHFYRFWGSYDITLSPGQSRVAVTVRLYNPTLVRNRYQLWINAAVPAREDMQFIFPVEYVAGHGFGGVHPWPMWDNGKYDHSLWSAQKESLGVFGWNADFMGAYYHSSDYGLVRYCPHTLAEGIKLWTWGTDSRWTKEYSIKMGPYCEIQGGRWPTQEMYGWLEPHQMDTWTEYWYPVRGLGGVDASSKDASLSARVAWKKTAATSAEVRLQVHRPIKGKFTISLNDKVLLAKDVSLIPGNVMKEKAPLPPAGPDDLLRATLCDEQGFVVISYDRKIAPSRSPKPNLPETIVPGGEGPQWDDYVAALSAELNVGDAVGAYDLYQTLVKDYPDFAPGWKAFGILLYKQADLPRAEEALSKVLALVPDDVESKYYLGLAKLDQGKPDALDTLKSVSGDVRFTHLAKYAIALETLKSGDAKAAVEILKEAGTGWSNDVVLWDTLAVAARLAGDAATASAALAAALSAEPLDPFASTEKLVAAGTPSPEAIQSALGADDDLYAETAFFYDSINQPAPAFQVAQAGKGRATSGLYHYYLAWFAARAGDEAAAKESLAAADAAGTDYVFPHRREDVAVMKNASALGANAGLAEYHTATLTYWRGAAAGALELWQSLVGKYDLPGIRRKVADAYYRGRVVRDMDANIEMYRKALAETPNDVEIYYALDNLYETTENTDARGKLLEKGRKLFPDDDQMLVRMARFLVRRNKAADAAELIESHKFKRSHQAYELTHVAARAVEETYMSLAMNAVRDKQKSKAVKYLEKAASARRTVHAWFD